MSETSSASNGAAIDSSSAPSELLSRLQASIDEPAVVADCLKALATSTGGEATEYADRVATLAEKGVDHDAHCKAIIKLGALGVLLSILSRHVSSADLIIDALLVTRNLASSDFGTDECNSGIIQGVITCMEHSNAASAGDARLAESFCQVLRNIAFTSEGREAVVSADAVPLIVAALSNHATAAPSVSSQACWALRNIAILAAGEEACIAAGAVPQIVTALKNHAASPTVCEQACWAFVNISFTPGRPGQAACLAAGVVDQVAVTLRDHATSAAVCEKACWAVNCITTFSETDASLASGIVPAITAALATFVTSDTICEHAAGALRNFAATAPGTDACVASGAIPALIAALSQHTPASPAVCEFSCWALMSISWSNLSHRAAVVAAGAVPLAVACLSVDSEGLHSQAEGLLLRLGYSGTGEAF